MPRLTHYLALATGLLGGICWIAHLFVAARPLVWAGSALLLVAAAAAGAGLSRLPWLAAVAGLGSAGLWWSVVEMARDVAGDRAAEGVLGAAAASAAVLAVLVPARRPAPAPPTRRATTSAPRGNHRG